MLVYTRKLPLYQVNRRVGAVGKHVRELCGDAVLGGEHVLSE
jgi:hypothetical protein